MEHQSITDDITGLYNHRHILLEVDKEIERAKRYGRFLSGMMIDVDNFKEINDVYGHLVGDSVLSEVSQVIQQNIRKIDIPGRFGGDEFLIILPETALMAARILGERILIMINKHSFKTARDYLQVSVSIGVFFIQDGKDYDRAIFIEKMDFAMTKAKRLGKNRVHAE